MSTLQNAPVNGQSFSQFLFYNRWNRPIQYGAATAVIIQLAIFKYLYPFANYIHGDSFSYLQAADQNLTIHFYPIGYSKFLRLVSVFAKPDWVLVSIQYLMIECSALFLLFTIFYFYKVGRVTQVILFCFMIFNPLFLHLGNMVSSDGVFLSLSMTWFALLLWIICNPSNKIIGWHAIVLFLAFTVRYNALIYPFIAMVAFGSSIMQIRKKIAGLGFAFLLIGWFVGLTMFQYKKLTGYWQFSPFSGWQWANNAMYAYREVDTANRKPVPKKFRSLDNMIRNFYDSNPNLQVPEAGTAYMWRLLFPLMQYNDRFKANDTSVSNFIKWAGKGPLYSSYGRYIIKKYPWYFLRNFVWPNAQKYFAPPVEYLEYYNWNFPTVPESAVKWFGYRNNRVRTRMKNGTAWVLQPYPYFVSITNLILLLMFLSYILLKGWQFNTPFNKCFLLAGFVWITYAGFNITAASAALRFQAFPVILSATFSLLLIDWLALFVQHLKRQSQQQKQESEYSQKASIV